MSTTDDELRDPSWNATTKEIMLRSSDGVEMKDSTENLSLKANVILLSYNRPKMIREAIQSVFDSTYQNFDLWIADDGSDFDIDEIAKEFNDSRIILFKREKMSPKDRARKSRIGENLNLILGNIPPQEMVYYLCDDDVLDPNWLARSIAVISDAPEYHVVVGDSYYFFDGQNPLEDSELGMPFQELPPNWNDIPTLYWSVGSFTHRAYCWAKEGIRWYDTYYGHSIDTNFIADLWNLHKSYLLINKPALYRREHENMLSAKLGRKDENGRYLSTYLPPPLKPEMIDGMME